MTTDERTPVTVLDQTEKQRPGPRRRRLVAGVVVVVAAATACCGGGYARILHDVSGATIPVPQPSTTRSTTTRAAATPSRQSLPIDRVADGRPGTIANTTMNIVPGGGFAVAGKVARWGYLAKCTAYACGPQEQQYVDVILQRRLADQDLTVTARVGVVDGETSDKPVRFEVLDGTSDVLYDRTLSRGQSDDLSIKVSIDTLRFLVTGPLGEVTAGIVDPTVTIDG